MERLFEEYRDKVFGFFVDFLNRRELARDMTQDIFVKLLQREDQLHQITDMDGYIYQMCRNHAFTHLKRAAHNKEYRNFILQTGDSAAEQQFNPIERRIDANHYGYLLHESLNKLPEQQRLVFSLSKEEGLTHKEIAQKLGISSHTVRNHLYQAVKSLRIELSRSGVDLMLVFILTTTSL